MGDMADYYLETSFLDTAIMYEDPLEAYEAGLLDELGYEIYGPQAKTCRCCGARGLVWEEVNGKWLLHDDKGIHQCPVNPYQPNFASVAQ